MSFNFFFQNEYIQHILIGYLLCARTAGGYSGEKQTNLCFFFCGVYDKLGKKDHKISIYNIKVHKNIDKWNNMISGEEEILGNFNFTTSNTSKRSMAFI